MFKSTFGSKINSYIDENVKTRTGSVKQLIITMTTEIGSSSVCLCEQMLINKHQCHHQCKHV